MQWCSQTPVSVCPEPLGVRGRLALGGQRVDCGCVGIEPRNFQMAVENTLTYAVLSSLQLITALITVHCGAFQLASVCVCVGLV